MGMNEDEIIVRRALELAKSKFEWTGKVAPVKHEPILDRLPWSDDYGPHICPVCRGVGWLVDSSKSMNYPDLVQCTSCDKVRTLEIARCWKASSMKADDPKAPSIKTFEPHTTEATAVLQAVNVYIRKPFGWLTMYGAPGTGKSHMSEAIARYLLMTNVPTFFITSSFLWEYLGGVARGEHDSTDYAERYRWVRDVPALVIDEMNLEKSTEFVIKTRRTLLDYRYKAALDGRSITVLASNDEPSQWQDAAVGDRALDSRFVAVYGGKTSYRRIKR